MPLFADVQDIFVRRIALVNGQSWLHLTNCNGVIDKIDKAHRRAQTGAYKTIMFSEGGGAMFRDINFRYTDAQEERLYAPELIEKAFVDIDNILEEIDQPEKFLVVGPKGAGKSALSSKLQIKSNSEWNLFVSADELEQFEFNLLEKTGAEKSASIGGALTVWQMLLAIRLMPLFLMDESIRENNQDLIRFNESLKAYGLASSESLIKIVQYTSRRGIFSNIKSAFAEIRGEKIDEEQFKIKDPAAIVEAIKSVLSKIKGANSKYYLVLDGLDNPIRHGRSNAGYIADLINASRLLNNFFAENRIAAKIIILVRDEILMLVPDPNLTKRINDNGISLKWYDNSRAPLLTSLFGVLEKRAALAGECRTAGELWRAWLPDQIHNRDAVGFVLDNTRYLPRDLISFFRELQRLKKEPPFSVNDVLAALNNYSDWYQQELSDALVGLVNENIRTEIPRVLTELGRDFEFAKLAMKLKDKGVESDAEAEAIAKELFHTSWIGNVWKTLQGSDRYAWQHRKKSASFNRNHKIIVHAGLWKSLNLV